jgi:6-phosphogluconolactonase
MALGLAAAAPLTESVPDGPGATRLHVHRDAHVWTWAAAVAIAADLRRDLQLRERTRLLVSADRTALPVYEALARAPLDWARVDVGLTDERWLHPDDPDSHAATIRRGLLHHHAAAARFEALTGAGRRIEDALAAANAHAQQPAQVAVLTLGNDGRLAGLSPSSRDHPRALESRQSYVAMDDSMQPGEAPWARRISLTPAGLARVHCCLLLVRGAVQRRLVEDAVQSRGGARSPALQALDRMRGELQVHWAP